MVHAGEDVGMWDEEDGFFYDVLRLPDGRAQRLKVRSMVGLLPLCAVTVFEGGLFSRAFLEDIPRRLAGPGRLRFVVQAVIETLLGVPGPGAATWPRRDLAARGP